MLSDFTKFIALSPIHAKKYFNLIVEIQIMTPFFNIYMLIELEKRIRERNAFQIKTKYFFFFSFIFILITITIKTSNKIYSCFIFSVNHQNLTEYIIHSYNYFKLIILFIK
jgi:hypothetical protein